MKTVYLNQVMTSGYFLVTITRLQGFLDVFFAISGFFVIESLKKSSIISFTIRRASRILPIYFTFVFLQYIAMFFLYKDNTDFYYFLSKTFFHYLFFISNYLNGYDAVFVAHFWSFAIEEQFYVLSILLFALLKSDELRKKVLITACIFFVFIRFNHVFNSDIIDFNALHKNTEYRISSILIGCIASYYIDFFKNKYILTAIVSLLMGSLLYSYFSIYTDCKYTTQLGGFNGYEYASLNSLLSFKPSCGIYGIMGLEGFSENFSFLRKTFIVFSPFLSAYLTCIAIAYKETLNVFFIKIFGFNKYIKFFVDKVSFSVLSLYVVHYFVLYIFRVFMVKYSLQSMNLFLMFLIYLVFTLVFGFLISYLFENLIYRFLCKFLYKKFSNYIETRSITPQ